MQEEGEDMARMIKKPDVRDRAKRLAVLLCESKGDSEILKVRFTYDAVEIRAPDPSA